MKKEQNITSKSLDDWSWFKGYYRSSHDKWDGVTHLRNFHELNLRDAAIFTLGDISQKNILDIGCGWGLYSITFAKMGANAFGQDISIDYIDKAKKLLDLLSLEATLKVGDATTLLFEDNYFDAVFSGDFFEHIDNQTKEKVLKEVFRVLKPGGIFTIKTPNLTYLKISIMVKRILAVFSGRNPLKLHIPHTRNNPDCQHHGLITYSEMEKLLESCMFHFPQITRFPLVRKGFPLFIGKILSNVKIFNEDIILTVRKPIFLGFYP